MFDFKKLRVFIILFILYFSILFCIFFLFFFFSRRRRHTSCSRDWSSDVCSSDLPPLLASSGPSSPSTYRRPRITRSRSGTSSTRDRRATCLPAMGVISKLAVGRQVSLRPLARSEERRVGKECRARWSPDESKERT